MKKRQRTLPEADLKIIGIIVEGTFHHYEDYGKKLIFGSHSWPSHRITVDRDKAEKYIEDYVNNLKSQNHE